MSNMLSQPAHNLGMGFALAQTLALYHPQGLFWICLPALETV